MIRIHDSRAANDGKLGVAVSYYNTRQHQTDTINMYLKK